MAIAWLLPAGPSPPRVGSPGPPGDPGARGAGDGSGAAGAASRTPGERDGGPAAEGLSAPAVAATVPDGAISGTTFDVPLGQARVARSARAPSADRREDASAEIGPVMLGA